MNDTMVCDNWPDKTALRTAPADVKYKIWPHLLYFSFNFIRLSKNNLIMQLQVSFKFIISLSTSVVSTDRYSKLSSSGPRPRSLASRAVTHFCTNNKKNSGNLILDQASAAGRLAFCHLWVQARPFITSSSHSDPLKWSIKTQSASFLLSRLTCTHRENRMRAEKHQQAVDNETCRMC